MADPVGAVKSTIEYAITTRKLIIAFCNIDSDFQELLDEFDRYKLAMDPFLNLVITAPHLLSILQSVRVQLAKLKATAEVWAEKLEHTLSDPTLLTASQTIPEDQLLSEEIVECLAISDKLWKKATSVKRQLVEMFGLTFRKGKKWSAVQVNKAMFLAEGKAALRYELNCFRDSVVCMSLAYMIEPKACLLSSFDPKNHPSIVAVMRAKERASSGTPIRQTIEFEEHFEHADLLGNDGCDVPVQKEGDRRLFLDRERRPEDSTIEARSRAVLASESFVRMFQLDEGEDPEEFRRRTGLLSCSALVVHHDEVTWEKRYRKEWDKLLEKNPAAWKLLSDQRPPLPPSPRHSVLFNLPRTMNGKPQTLRCRLDDDRVSNQKPFLPNRVRFACVLAESMTVLHAMGLVHKGIRPDNILVINEGGDKECFTRQIGMPYFIGFEQVRGEEQESGMRNYFTNEFRRNIYNSSDFFEQTRYRKYVMLDDIYSFGVTLIEILTWQSFFKYEKGEYQDDTAWKRDESVLSINEECRDTWTDAIMSKAEELKHISYTLYDIVHLCLHNGNAFKDKGAHGMTIGHENYTLSLEASLGIKFIEKVSMELRAFETAISKRLDSSIF